MEPRHSSFLGLGSKGFHKVAYVEWGDRSNPRKLMCVHGLTRQGRDFDMVARAMADRYHMACPDIVGRGQSDWLVDKAGYGYPQYCADMNVLIGRLAGTAFDWLGTSMGGLIGMFMAAHQGSPIRRLIMNDIGPLIPKEGVARLAVYAGKDPQFASLADAVAYTRAIAAPFGKLSDAEWLHLTLHGIKQQPEGTFRLCYDPAIAAPLEGEIVDVDLWPFWDRIKCPVLVLRGANSDLLRSDTAEEMKVRGPKARVVEIADCGHAPALMAPEQIRIVRDFLLEQP